MEVADLTRVANTIEDETEVRSVLDREQSLSQQVGLRISADGDVSDVAAADPGHFQDALNGECRESSPMLDPAKALLFDSRNELSIAQEGGRHIAVVRIDSQHIRRHAYSLDTAASFRRSRRSRIRASTRNRNQKPCSTWNTSPARPSR